MALSRPTLGTLIDQAKNEINALVPGADARMRFSIFSVFASIWGALTDGLYSALNYLSRQLFTMTADIEYLTLIGQSYGVNQLLATVAAGSAIVTGTPGATILTGTILSRADGLIYQATAGVVIPAAGFETVPVISQISGLIANADAGVALQCSVAGVTGVAVSSDAISNGSNDETVSALRARILFRLQNPPGAGTVADWTRWAYSQDASVTRVWPIAVPYGNGTVGIVYAQDNATVTPPASSVAAMQAYLQAFQPMGSLVYVFPPVLVPINFTISGISNPATRANVVTELTDLLYREGYPGNTIPLSRINATISDSVGEYDHVLTTPAGPLVFASQPPNYQLGTMGAITWQ